MQPFNGDGRGATGLGEIKSSNDTQDRVVQCVLWRSSGKATHGKIQGRIFVVEFW